MLDLDSYKKMLSSHGKLVGQTIKNQSDFVMNETFTRDPNYKRVYILTNDGWKYEDAKYQIHTTPSILKDNVDYYLQFRPKIHYSIGSYVIIPDDTSFDINAPENPFEQDISERTQWWLIVGRDDANTFVRYNVLKCNWNFQWIENGEIQNCFGCKRTASSYTSGIWTDEYSTSLDNITAAWLPDVYHVYTNYLSLGMNDTRTITHGIRFMISNNSYDPKIYQVTKVVELEPDGIIKLTLKQDDFNEKRDNVELRICDYYNDNGDKTTEIKIPNVSDDTKLGNIDLMYVNDDNELDYKEKSISSAIVNIGITSYFKAEFSDDGISPEWKLILIDENNEFTDEEKDYYVGLIKLYKFDNLTLSVKPGKANSLVGKRFNLIVSDALGDYYSSIIMEVSK